ncbi:MAG: TolC family protein [Chitinispirillaceae bacterium]
MKTATFTLTLLLTCIRPYAVIWNDDSVLTLQEAESCAVIAGFDVRGSEKQLDTRTWAYRQAVTSYLPRISFSSQYIRLGGTVSQFGSPTSTFPEGGGRRAKAVQQIPGDQQMPDGEYDQTEDLENFFLHDLTIQQPIINGGSQYMQIKISGAGREAAEFQLNSARQEAIYSTREAYLNAVSAKARVEAAQSSLEFNSRNLQSARIRQQSGVVPITEVLRWEAEVAQSRAALAQARAGADAARYSLFSSMGILLDTLSQSFKLLSYDHFVGRCTTLTVDTAVGKAIQQNPSYQALKTTTRIARLQKYAAITGYIPSLNGFFTLQWQGVEEFLPDQDPGWYLGLNLNIPIFQGFSNTSGYFQAVSEYEESLVSENQAHNRFITAARTAARNFLGARQQLEAADQRQKLLEQTLDIMQTRYESGVAGLTDLLEVSLSTEQARLAYIDALFSCLRAHAQYLLNIGKLEVTR